LLGRKASKIFVASDGMEKFFPREKIMITGNPVRQNIVGNTISRTAGIEFFGLNPAMKTVFVTGGSLGAKGINEAIDANVDAFTKNNVQLIWQTGKPYAEKASARAAENRNIWANSFITQMEYAYAAADVVISRAGAMSVAELCVAKKPVLFVPFPFAAEDHQTANAQNLVNKQAGIMIKDSEAKEKLVPTVIALARDEQQQNLLKENIAKLAITNADEVVATEILRLIS
jgi:UDP-N-acetylglucosamine--N-acetylmuramyl-(pentapeptide) pyrophosphoryl-undecaprenol N-acetylglucosamine transferase